MAAEKVKKRKPVGKRRGRPGCLSMLFFMFVIAAAVIAVIFIFFKIKIVEVNGVSHYNGAVVESATGIKADDNLVFINKYSISRKIMAELPYISDVTITRNLPDTLVITVTESRAAAYFEAGDSFWLINASGKMLERITQRPQNLALLSGVSPVLPVEGSVAMLGTDSETKLKTVSDTLAALERAGMTGDVSEIGIGGVYDVTVSYLDRFTVKLGAPEELDYKLEYLLQIVKEELQPNERGTLDLSRLIEDDEARFIAE